MKYKEGLKLLLLVIAAVIVSLVFFRPIDVKSIAGPIDLYTATTTWCQVEPKVVTKEDVKVEIMRQALAADVNIYSALRIAKCESGFNYLAKNKMSSAKGVYQFLNSTWTRNCSGNVLNHKDNIACFIKFYKKYPRWWVCK